MSAVLLVACLALSLNSFAQQKPKPALTAEQIIEKSIEATGGRQALEKIKSTAAKGIMEIEPSEVHSTMEFYAKAPNRRLVVTFIEGFGEVRQGFDGQAAWTQDPTRGLRDVTGPELADLKQDSMFNAELKWRDLYPSAELVGREKLEGRDTYVIRLKPRTGKPITRYYDAQNFLLLRQVATREMPQGSIEITADFSDFRDVDGVKAPFQIKQVMPAVQVTIKMTEIRNNVEIEDAKFAKPAEK